MTESSKKTEWYQVENIDCKIKKVKISKFTDKTVTLEHENFRRKRFPVNFNDTRGWEVAYFPTIKEAEEAILNVINKIKMKHDTLLDNYKESIRKLTGEKDA